MTLEQAVRTVLAKYSVFDGRASRPEFWWFMLASFLAQAACGLLAILSENLANVAGGLLGLALLIPTLAAGARRLHDTDRSGWWQLIGAVPLVGLIVLIVFMTQRSDPLDNRFGPQPLA